MFDTNDVYNDAIRGSSIYTKENSTSVKPMMGSKVVATLLLTSIAFVGFNFYSSMDSISTDLVVKNEILAEIQTESELLVVVTDSNSESAYLSALREIESELTEERENINLDASEQMNLSSAMNSLINDTLLADNTNYTKELRKEIGVELDEVVKSENIVVDSMSDSRTVIVKKGDTLQGISNKFYGDAMNYKRIIASNDSLLYNDTIYVGQTILLPY